MSLGLTTTVGGAWSPYTSLVVGLLAAALIPFAAWALTRRRPPPPPRDVPAPVPRFQSAEQRRAVRRPGNPVRVLIVSGGSRPFEGFVIDRSAGGFCLTVPRPVASGAALAIRAAAAPDGSPWVKLVVVHCAKLGAGVWRVGCQFASPPPAGVLHLFG